MEKKELSIWVQAILCVPKVGRKTAWKIFENLPEDISSRDEFISFAEKESEGIPRMPPLGKSLVIEMLEKAEGIIEQTCSVNRGSVLNYSELPNSLRMMDDPPLLLHCLGDTTLINNKCAAIIGTRNPTDFGTQSAHTFGSILAKQGFTVVSGLALGCDTQGHLGCLDAEGPTIAVLAHGLDTMYPIENRELAIRILSQGGLLLSEYPQGVSVRGPQFVERDRLQAALSQFLVVVETTLDGGTLHTVRFAIKNKVPVFAMSHPEELKDHEQVQGNLQILSAEDAKPIEPNEMNISKVIENLNQPTARVKKQINVEYQEDLFGSTAQEIKKYDLDDAEIKYFPSFFTKEEADHFISQLIETVEWRQDTINFYGKVHNIPRLTAWFGDQGKNYTYSNIQMNPAPWTDLIKEIKERVEDESKKTFNSLLINYYRSGSDKVSWHSDDEPELGKNPVIGSVSLGAERKFKLRHKSKELKEEINLCHGSFLLMGGPTQHYWEHEIPKTAKKIEPRLNLTFRNVE